MSVTYLPTGRGVPLLSGRHASATRPSWLAPHAKYVVGISSVRVLVPGAMTVLHPTAPEIASYGAVALVRPIVSDASTVHDGYESDRRVELTIVIDAAIDRPATVFVVAIESVVVNPRTVVVDDCDAAPAVVVCPRRSAHSATTNRPVRQRTAAPLVRLMRGCRTDQS